MKEDEKKMQEKYLEFQMVQQQIEQLSKYMEELDAKLQEFTLTKNNIESMDKIPQNTESLVSLAPGIFAQAELKENKKFVINVGANILVEKTIPQISEMLDKQIKEISQAQVQMDQNLMQLNFQEEGNSLEVYSHLCPPVC